MKKIIGGKMYDTETATLVGEWDNGVYGNDFSRCAEMLYRKRTGEYFLYGEGGPMSKYAQNCGDNEWSGGEIIIPLSITSAMEWAEEHLSGDEYEAIFGKIPEDETKENVTFYLSRIANEKLKRCASWENKSKSEILETLISQHLD